MTQTSDDSPNCGGSENTSDATRIPEQLHKKKEAMAEPKGLESVNEGGTELSARSHKTEEVGTPAATTANASVTTTEPLDMELETSSASSLVPKGVPMCAVCSEPCIRFCKSCKKVSYCSKEHQMQHLKIHQPDCYPVMIQINSIFGSHLVVTRDVRRGEVILREKPLLCSPFLNGNGEINKDPETSLCLSCHKVISVGTCSKCEWPVCSEKCERDPIHGQQECKIFAEYHVQRSALCDKPAQYLCVALLRILLERKREEDHCTSSAANSNPKASSSKWTQFMEVVKRQEPVLKDVKFPTCYCATNLISKSLGPIIHQQFPFCTDVEIDQMARTLRTSSFITDSREGNCINDWDFYSMNSNNCDLGEPLRRNDDETLAETESATEIVSRCSRSTSGKTLCVYHLGSMLTSNCIPNCVWLIHNSGLDFYLRASQPIKTGERISITYVDPLLATHQRRETLWQEKYLSCSCSRCSDPSESCTFFSAIKCPSKTTDPLAVAYSSCHGSCCCEKETDATTAPMDAEKKLCAEGMAEWKCNVCLMRQSSDFIQDRLKKMSNFFEQDVFTTAQDGNGNLENVELYLDKINNLVGKFTHVNYFSVVRLELKVLGKLSKLLEDGKVPFGQMEKWAMKMIELCKKGLKVVNVLCPRLSAERGRLLYFLQQALVINLLFKTSRGMRANPKESLSTEELRKKFHEVLLARKEVHEIFAITKGEHCEETRMLALVQHDSIEIRLLKKHFKLHQSNYNMNSYSSILAHSPIL